MPDTRAVLCDRAISYMLADAAKWRVREAGQSIVAIPPAISLAIEVAHRIHTEEEDAAEGSRSGITPSMVHETAVTICSAMARADTSRGAPVAQDLAQRFLKSSRAYR